MLAIACAALVWLLGVLGAGDFLHGHVHDHAAHEEHACAITLLAQGAENPAPAVTWQPQPEAILIASLRLAAQTVPPPADQPLRPGRDPPLA